MGGAGFIEEYDAATLYRDERINRIFEGTNEINRLIVGSYTLKKAILEELPMRDLIKSREEDWIPDRSILDVIVGYTLAGQPSIPTVHRSTASPKPGRSTIDAYSSRRSKGGGGKPWGHSSLAFCVGKSVVQVSLVRTPTTRQT